MKLEIVTHCWNYPRLLTYQLSSLILHPPKNINVTATVLYTDNDESTVAALNFFKEVEKPATVTIKPWLQGQRQLMCRAYGRDEVARQSDADLLWFADADYAFGQGALDSLVDLTNNDSVLFFPKSVLVNRVHELGDKAIDELKDGLKLVDVDKADFVVNNYHKAIGGVQIVRGSVVREIGYCPGSKRKATWSENWLNTVEDRTFRLILKTNGHAIPIPEVYRIRHSRAGRFEPGVKL